MRPVRRRISSQRIHAAAGSLLEASTLCALATASRQGRAHVNTMYFASGLDLTIVWISAPEAQHSRNLGENASAAIVVFDSAQRWGGRDRGIQLFGSARELSGRRASAAEAVYRERFPSYEPGGFPGLRLYGFRPSRIKLFDEESLGAGLFVTARVRGGGRVEWARSERYDIRTAD